MPRLKYFNTTTNEWEYVGTGGGGGTAVAQSDWNAAEGESGHILNRTHYTEGGIVELLPECNPIYDEGEGIFVITGAIPFVVGEEITVNWNGTPYKCLTYAFVPDEEMGECVVFGNSEALTDMFGLAVEANDAPFIFLSVALQSVTVVLPLDDSTEVTVSILGNDETIHKLDNKYLDLDWIPTKKAKETVILPEMLTSEYNNELRPTSLPLGTVLAVYWDGVRHECTVTGSGDARYFGYLGGNPFNFLAMYESLPYTIDCADGAEHTVSVSLFEYEYNVIPAGYLGEGAGASIDLNALGMATVGTNETVVFNADTSDIMEKLEKGGRVKVVFEVRVVANRAESSGPVTATLDGTCYRPIEKIFFFSAMLYRSDCLFAITLQVEDGAYTARVQRLLDNSTT